MYIMCYVSSADVVTCRLRVSLAAKCYELIKRFAFVITCTLLYICYYELQVYESMWVKASFGETTMKIV